MKESELGHHPDNMKFQKLKTVIEKLKIEGDQEWTPS